MSGVFFMCNINVAKSIVKIRHDVNEKYFLGIDYVSENAQVDIRSAKKTSPNEPHIILEGKTLESIADWLAAAALSIRQRVEHNEQEAS